MFVILATTQFNVKTWVVECFKEEAEADALVEKLEPKRYRVSKEDVTKLLAIHPRAVPKNFEDVLNDHINYNIFDLNGDCEYLRYSTLHSFEPEWEPYLIEN